MRFKKDQILRCIFLAPEICKKDQISRLIFSDHPLSGFDPSKIKLKKDQILRCIF
jgi:ABC-type transporter Mla maintaining outer membrane lipid asymmetry ATPase subunit MlaF